MHDFTPEVSPESTPNLHLGFRVALFIVLGQVASNQSETRQALETHDSLQS